MFNGKTHYKWPFSIAMFRDASGNLHCESYCVASLSDRVFVQIAILGSLEVSNMINDHEHRNGSALKRTMENA